MCESHEATSVASNNEVVVTIPEKKEQNKEAERERYRETLIEDRRRDREECQSYPLTRQELRQLARYWANFREENAHFIYAYQCFGGSDLRDGWYAGDRLALMDDILGEGVVNAVYAEVKAEQHRRDGWEYWDAARRHDDDYREKMRQDHAKDDAYKQEKLTTEKTQQMFDDLSKDPFGYRIDESGDLWTFVRSEDGKRLNLHFRMIDGAGMTFPRHSIAAPFRWTPRFGISDVYPRIC